VRYSRIENCNTIDEIVHPTVREGLRFMKIDRGIEINHDGDLPARSGMGSSSSFTVGFLNALHALKGEMPSKHQLAAEAMFIEQNCINETVGSQDQVSAAYGGFNHISFLKNGEFSVRPVTIAQERMDELNAHIMMFYTGIQRTASNMAASYVNDMDVKRRQLRIMSDLVEEGISALSSNKDITIFGELLHESWEAKRSLSSLITNPEVEEIYTEARSVGAVGGKLLGAGGGGFMVFFVPPPRHDALRERLKGLIHVPVRFEFSGTQIIFFDSEKDYTAEEKIRSDKPIQAFHELNCDDGVGNPYEGHRYAYFKR
jgi:D-glycero-alpha-D-manno-heptose-7-phosphate kinase